MIAVYPENGCFMIRRRLTRENARTADFARELSTGALQRMESADAISTQLQPSSNSVEAYAYDLRMPDRLWSAASLLMKSEELEGSRDDDIQPQWA